MDEILAGVNSQETLLHRQFQRKGDMRVTLPFGFSKDSKSVQELFA